MVPRGQERAYRSPGTNPLTTDPYLVSILIAQTCEGTLAPYTSCMTKHSALPSGTTSVAANRHPRTWCAAQNVQYCNSYYVVSNPPVPLYRWSWGRARRGARRASPSTCAGTAAGDARGLSFSKAVGREKPGGQFQAPRLARP